MEKFAGWFVFHETDDGWRNCFGVEDDDGMTFCLESLKRLHGKPVMITIAECPEIVTEESKRMATRGERDREREAMKPIANVTKESSDE